jgi:hypothetical protein
MSDRHFFLRAHDCTKQWENYVRCVDRVGQAADEMQAAIAALASARSALEQVVVLQDETADVSS